MIADLDRHSVADHFLCDPPPDRIYPDDFAAIVVDVGILGEGRHNRVGIKRIDGPDVFGNDTGKLISHGTLLDDAAGWPSAGILSAPARGGSIASLRVDSPVGGECTLTRYVLLARHR